MARWFFVAVGVFGFTVLTCLWVYSPSTQAADKEPPVVGFSGKPIFVQAEKDVAFTLEKPEVRQLGGRAFVVGRELQDDPYDFTPQRFVGGTVWVAVDGITQLIELEPRKREE